MPTAKIAPSILAADFRRLAEDIREAEEAGADWIHVDVMDGHFVPNITIGPPVVQAARSASGLSLDVHLMIEAPERYLEAFANAGADRITVHQETCPHLHRTVQRIRECGARPGVALNPATPLETLTEIVSYVDLVLIMTVNPGFGGQAFIPTSIDKVRRCRSLLDATGKDGAELQVDGGIDAGTAPDVVKAGASVLVAGTAVFRHRDGLGEGVRALRRAVERAGVGEEA